MNKDTEFMPSNKETLSSLCSLEQAGIERHKRVKASTQVRVTASLLQAWLVETSHTQLCSWEAQERKIGKAAEQDNVLSAGSQGSTGSLDHCRWMPNKTHRVEKIHTHRWPQVHHSPLSIGTLKTCKVRTQTSTS